VWDYAVLAFCWVRYRYALGMGDGLGAGSFFFYPLYRFIQPASQMGFCYLVLVYFLILLGRDRQRQRQREAVRRIPPKLFKLVCSL